MKNAGQVVTRTMLLEHVWDYHFDPQTNVIGTCTISRAPGPRIEKDFCRNPLLRDPCRRRRATMMKAGG